MPHLIAFWSFGARKLAFKRELRGFSLSGIIDFFLACCFLCNYSGIYEQPSGEEGTLDPHSQRILRRTEWKAWIRFGTWLEGLVAREPRWWNVVKKKKRAG